MDTHHKTAAHHQPPPMPVQLFYSFFEVCLSPLFLVILGRAVHKYTYYQSMLAYCYNVFCYRLGSL